MDGYGWAVDARRRTCLVGCFLIRTCDSGYWSLLVGPRGDMGGMRVRERRRPEGQAGAWTERRDVGSWRGMGRWKDGKMRSGGRVGEAG